MGKSKRRILQGGSPSRTVSGHASPQPYFLKRPFAPQYNPPVPALMERCASGLAIPAVASPPITV